MANFLDETGLAYFWDKIKTKLAGKSDTGHKHAAGDITSGAFAADRIPNLAASKITSGTLGIDRMPTVTVAKGGTGQTATTSTNTVKNIITANTDNVTIVSADYAQWGKLGSFYIEFHNKNAINVTAGGNVSNINIGTIASGMRPKIRSVLISNGDGIGQCWYVLANNGALSLAALEGTGAARTVAANSDFAVFGTILLA